MAHLVATCSSKRGWSRESGTKIGGNTSLRKIIVKVGKPCDKSRHLGVTPLFFDDEASQSLLNSSGTIPSYGSSGRASFVCVDTCFADNRFPAMIARRCSRQCSGHEWGRLIAMLTSSVLAAQIQEKGMPCQPNTGCIVLYWILYSRNESAQQARLTTVL